MRDYKLIILARQLFSFVFKTGADSRDRTYIDPLRYYALEGRSDMSA